ncbi:MAG: rod shape-determining protein RodA [Calditrichaeota bacterium]|nr:rod shape-determining protein RodA [Calditrichota bacterium]
MNTLKNRLSTINFPLLISALGMVVIGIILIYSADHSQGLRTHFTRQVYFSLAGLLLLTVAASITPRIYYALAYVFYIVGMIGLVLVLIMGIIGFGAKRWLVVGGINVQPSEPLKLALIFAVARVLSSRSSYISYWKMIGKAALLGGIPTIFLLLQPDLGTATVLPIIIASMLAWFGIPLKIFILFLLPFLSLFLTVSPWIVLPLIAVGFAYLWKSGIRWVGITGMLFVCAVATITAPTAWNQLEPYQQKRLTTFLNPAADPLGSGYQVIQSKVAIGSGGFAGQGFLKGPQTQLRFLPEQHTDFIFALAGEEFGFVGVTVILVFLVLYGWSGFRLAMRTKNQFMSFVAVGITTLVLYHAVVNIGMVIGVLPVTGLPLPFLSYGGSFLITCMTATGILLSVGVYHRER